MKTIKQIADEIGVTKQAIFYRIKRPPLSNTLQTFISKCDGVLMVSFDGENLIKQAFNNEITKNFDDKEPSKENDEFDGRFDGEIIKLLQDNIKVLQEQLKTKDLQIAELTAAVRIQAESINADRKNELANTLIDGQKEILEGEVQEKNPKKKKWVFWKRNK